MQLALSLFIMYYFTRPRPPFTINQYDNWPSNPPSVIMTVRHAARRHQLLATPPRWRRSETARVLGGGGGPSSALGLGSAWLMSISTSPNTVLTVTILVPAQLASFLAEQGP